MSRVDFGAKPWVFPMPVLIVGTYDANGVPNAMNAARLTHHSLMNFLWLLSVK